MIAFVRIQDQGNPTNVAWLPVDSILAVLENGGSSYCVVKGSLWSGNPANFSENIALAESASAFKGRVQEAIEQQG
jgi:hypothetical protein